MQPKVIKSEDDQSVALCRIDEIFDAQPGTPEGDELELLVTLVELYEERAYPIGKPNPIAAIRFRMDQQGLKQKDLVPYIGSASKVSEVLSGARSLSLAMIQKLTDGLGIPAEVLVRPPERSIYPNEHHLDPARLPFAEMLKRGWFANFKGTVAEARRQSDELLASFMGKLSLDEVQPALLRRHVRPGSQPDSYALLAWYIRVMNIASSDPGPRYTHGSLTSELVKDLRNLSYYESGPIMARELLKSVGVKLVVEKHLSKTYLDGAASIMPDGRPLIGLTLRYDRLDSFWFTLFHELGHVALHLGPNDEGSERQVYFDDLDQDSWSQVEKEADSWAADSLIPQSHWKAGRLNRSKVSAANILAFAEKHRISPAIPAGRLRFQRSNYKIFSRLVGTKQVRTQFGLK